jgi:hypothetical protein
MNKKPVLTCRVFCFFLVFILLFGVFAAVPAFGQNAVNVILKNASSSSVEVELIDQYGGNFKAEIGSGMTQNHTLKVGSPIKVGGNTVHVVSAGDEGKTVTVAGN